jgi:hypothetical protein
MLIHPVSEFKFETPVTTHIIVALQYYNSLQKFQSKTKILTRVIIEKQMLLSINMKLVDYNVGSQIRFFTIKRINVKLKGNFFVAEVTWQKRKI